MKRRNLYAAAAASVLVACGLTACGSDDGGDGPIKITLLEYQQARVDVMKELLPEFESAMAAEGKQIKVELVSDILTDGDYKTKLTQQLVAGTAPDVIDTGESNMTGWATAGYLLELDKYLDEWPDWSSFYDVSRERAKQSDGHYYSVPHEGSVQNLFVRKDVLENMGIDSSQPQTWDELIERLKAVKAKTGKAAIVIPAGTAWGDGSWAEGFLPIVGGTGSTLYDPKTGRWTLESPGLTASFELFAELTKEGLLPVQDLLNPKPWEPTKYKAFPAGTLPVSAQGTWGWRYDWGPKGTAPIEDVQKKVVTWNYPALVEGTKPYSISGGGYSFAVNAKTKHADAAMELVKWLSSGKPLATQLEAIGAAAPRKGIADLEPYKSDAALLDAEQKLQDSIAPPTGEGSDQISQAVQKATAEILTGKADGAKAAADFADEARQILDKSLVAQ